MTLKAKGEVKVTLFETASFDAGDVLEFDVGSGNVRAYKPVGIERVDQTRSYVVSDDADEFEDEPRIEEIERRYDQLTLEFARVVGERDEAKADAARYRYWRAQGHLMVRPADGVTRSSDWLEGENLDAWTDEAIKQGEAAASGKGLDTT